MQNKGIGDVQQRIDNFYPTLLCAEISVMESLSCSSAIDIIKKLNTPKSVADNNLGPKFNNLPLWTEIYGNNKFDEGLRLAGLKILERVDGKLTDSDNVSKDLRDSFGQSGMSKADAEDSALKIMGLISNGANNTSIRISYLLNKSPYDAKSIALTLISSSLQYLDYLKSAKGMPLYSLPTEVKSDCLSFKYHHFWMAAFMARSLVKDYDVGPKAAAMAAFTANKGYHILRDIGRPKGKGASSVGVLSRAAFDPVHQIVRTDLAFAAAGAHYGSEGMNKKIPINMDSATVALLEKTEALEPLSKEELVSKTDYERYKIWKKIFSPNTAFEMFYK